MNILTRNGPRVSDYAGIGNVSVRDARGITGEEAAAMLSKVTGREVHYEGFPPDVLRAQSEDMARMFEWFDSTGYTADIKSLRRDFPEVKWHTFEQWARQQDWSVLDQGR